MDSARLRQLASDLRADREDLDRILGEAERCLNDLAGRAPSYLELRGAGDIVHDFYNVVEHFFERVAVEMNGGLPAGPDSHTQLLRRMSRAVEEVRPAITDDALRDRLHEYLRFRHVFRHGYAPRSTGRSSYHCSRERATWPPSCGGSSTGSSRRSRGCPPDWIDPTSWVAGVPARCPDAMMPRLRGLGRYALVA